MKRVFLSLMVAAAGLFDPAAQAQDLPAATLQLSPPEITSGMRYQVEVLAVGSGPVSATLDWSGYGIAGETVELASDGERWIASGVVPELDFTVPGAGGPVAVSAVAGAGESLAAEFIVVADYPEIPAEQVVTSPATLRPGAALHVSATVPFLRRGTVCLEVPTLEKMAVPLVVAGAGQSSAVLPVSPEAEAVAGQNATVLVDLYDGPGNRYRVMRAVPVVEPGVEGPAAPTITILPEVLLPGGAFEIVATSPDAAVGAVTMDFRPFLSRMFRIPLNFENGVARTIGNVPVEIAPNAVGFISATAQYFSASGRDRVTVRTDAPLRGSPPVSDISLGIESPEGGTITQAATVAITGRVGADVETVEAGGQTATPEEGRFSLEAALKEGRNDIAVTAKDGSGGISTVSVSVTRDTTAPILNIEVPGDGSIVAMPQVTVAGFVNDVVTGTVNSDDVTVMINGLPASVANRSYEIQDFALQPGKNTLTVTATDLAGNSRERQIEVDFQDAAAQQRILVASGNNQVSIIGNVLPDPLKVQLVDGDGKPLAGVVTRFEVARGDGKLLRFPDEETGLNIATDEDGFAQVFFMLGSRTGEGNNRVAVTAPGFTGEVVFCSSAFGDAADVIAALTPTTQVGEIGRPLPQPFQVFVTDRGGNPKNGVDITFDVIRGGFLDGTEKTVNTTTNENGRASVILTLSDDLEINGNLVRATFTGDPNGEGALFQATGMRAGIESETRLTGLVLDAGNRPVPQATVHVEGETTETTTDEEGQFILPNVPVGAVRLLVDGSTTTLPGEWPELEYDLVTVAGQDNSVDRPIYLLPLDTEGSKTVGGAEEVTLEMAGVPGTKLTVFPGSVTGPNGESEIDIRWTQVNLERVPMDPPNGSVFMLAGTLQPPGVRFDPPARIQIPNMGAPPGQQVEIFSFDHDVGEFVAIGVATVSEDGSVVASDPGFGLTKSGWHGCVPPPPPCRPWQGDPPMDDECTKYEKIPADGECAYDRYEPKKAAITSLEVMADGSAQPDKVPLGTEVNFTAMAEGENHDGIEYEWSGFPGGAMQSGASTSFKFEEEGDFTINCKAQCTGCPMASMTKTITIKVVNEKVPEVKDSDGRKAVDRLLQIVTQTGETITGTAKYPDTPGAPPGNPEWKINSDGASFTRSGDTVNFTARPNIISPTNLILVDLQPSEHIIECDGLIAARVIAFDGTRRRIRVNFEKARVYKDRFEEALELVLGGNKLKPEFLKGRFEFINEWKECPSSWKASWTFRASATYDPFIGAKGRITFGPSTVIPGFIAKWVAAGFFVEFNGGVFARGSVEKEACEDVTGKITLGGKIGIGVGGEAIAADLASFVAKGATEVQALGDIVPDRNGVTIRDATVKWKGIFVDVSIKMLWGWVEVERRWDVVEGSTLVPKRNIRIVDF